MTRELLVKRLKTYEDEFKDFMDIKEFPTYQLCTKEVSTIIADFKGFEAVASTSYQPQNNSHTLSVSTNIALSKYFIFHEFTHMLDSEMNVKGDKMRYAGLSGFTEYHASQVELMQLLGANTVDEVLSFSMGTIITTIAGEKSVYQYVNEKHRHGRLTLKLTRRLRMTLNSSPSPPSVRLPDLLTCMIQTSRRKSRL